MGEMGSRLLLFFVLALGSGALVSCLAGSDDDGSSNNAGTGGAAAGAAGGGTSGSGTGGEDTGGSAGSGTGGATMGGSGGSTAGVGGMACCLAVPTCGTSEVEVPSCLGGMPCREVSLCCSTILCAYPPCTQLPTCDVGDQKVTSCPASSVCYSRTQCETTITCEEGPNGSAGASGSGGFAGAGGSGGVPANCNPELEHDRDYVADSPAECAVILYACPDHTEAFNNDCGCGCEQSADCPEFVDCMPGPDPRPGCTDDERARCPYTDVAF